MLDRERQWVPDDRSDILKGPLPKSPPAHPWDTENPSIWGWTKRTRRTETKQLGEVWRSCTRDNVEAGESYFVLNPAADRQPMETKSSRTLQVSVVVCIAMSQMLHKNSSTMLAYSRRSISLCPRINDLYVRGSMIDMYVQYGLKQSTVVQWQGVLQDQLRCGSILMIYQLPSMTDKKKKKKKQFSI